MKLADSIHRFNSFDFVEWELKEISRRKIKCSFFLDDDYPFRLRQIPVCPILIYYKGTAKISPPRIISIVGTRKISSYGRAFVKELIGDISSHDVSIVSGMAYGVDILAHKEALANDLPTIGVLAHGLDRIYPALHLRVAEQMLQSGALITEYPTKTNPDRENFPKRNRIVAGLSDLVLVVESAERGGSLITAELANQYNREVMALPGNIQNTHSKGCNFLIKKNKAHLIDSAEDLIELLNWDLEFKPGRQKTLFVEFEPEEEEVFNRIKEAEEIGVDQLLAQCTLGLSQLAAVLLNLELKNCISSLPGKRYRIQ
jgi:DNA processing protein